MKHLRSPEKRQEREEKETFLRIIRNWSRRDHILAETINLIPRNKLRKIWVQKPFQGQIEEKIVRHIESGEILTDSRGRGFYNVF